MMTQETEHGGLAILFKKKKKKKDEKGMEYLIFR